jgi:hypothetical protein
VCEGKKRVEASPRVKGTSPCSHFFVSAGDLNRVLQPARQVLYTAARFLNTLKTIAIKCCFGNRNDYKNRPLYSSNLRPYVFISYCKISKFFFFNGHVLTLQG